MLEFRKITWDNYREVAQLKVSKEQEKLVDSVLESVADAYISIESGNPIKTYGIYHDDTPIGFTMYNYHTADGEVPEADGEKVYCIWRLLIDEKFQGKGFGKQAFQKLLNEIRTRPLGDADYVYVGYEEENQVAENLYKSFGFVGAYDVEDEIVYASRKLG